MADAAETKTFTLDDLAQLYREGGEEALAVLRETIITKAYWDDKRAELLAQNPGVAL